MFNAFKYTRALQEQGFTEGQAKTSIEILIEIMNDQFATKSDLEQLETRLHSEMKLIRSDLETLEQKMTIKLGSMLAISIGIMTAIQKTLN